MKKCKCGTGNYCRTHRRYGIPWQKIAGTRTLARTLQFQAITDCGGGRRIIRNETNSH